MAEGRKNPAASKVATPKVGGGQKDIGDMSEVLHKAIGARYETFHGVATRYSQPPVLLSTHFPTPQSSDS